jgi:hypothetical protein
MSKTFSRSVRKWSAVAVLGITAATSVLALEIARMRVPEELAAVAHRLPASGYGGANRGRFVIGDYRGDFTRIESRFAVFDPLYAANRGKSSFTLAGPGVEDTIAAECRFKERVVTVGVLTFDATKLAYVCDIKDADGGTAGSLTLGEPKPSGFESRLLARAERKGLAEIGSVRIEIASVHQYDRSKLSSQTPVGYVLSLDSQAVGALELTDSNPTFFLHAGMAPNVQRATLIAALGLSVLRDPAVSALGD